MAVEPMTVRYSGVRAGDIEVSVVSAPRAVLREILHVFPSRSMDDKVCAVATCQKSAMDLVNWGDDVGQEKDRLLEVFVEFANKVCQDLIAEGYWADFIDPCSGLPSISKEGNSVYDEVAGMQALLKYDITQAGPCKVLMHPTWGSAVYPATAFSTAPAELIVNTVSKYNAA